jgi:hypothetical protein
VPKIQETGTLSNAENAQRLSPLVQMLTVEKADFYKIPA